jgi:flagellar FliL protein
MAEEKKDPSEEQPKKSKLAFMDNKAVLLGAIVIVQVVVAVGLTQFVIVPRLGVSEASVAAQPAEELAAETPELGALVGLEEIICTLAGNPQKPRYLRINVSLEVKDQMTAQVVGTRLPQLRDVVLMVLSDKTAEELSTAEGKKGLRDEIFRRLDEKMPAGMLMNVYFSDLVVQ